MLLPALPASSHPLRDAMRQQWLAPDEELVSHLLAAADIGEAPRAHATDYARVLVQALRSEQAGKGGVDALLNEFSLSTQEGVALMCLAEALLRVPDTLTADKLIRDKLQGGDWSLHLGRSNSTFVNASAWALLFTGKLVNYSDAQQQALHSALKRSAGRLGQPLIREAVRRAMTIMGDVFVMGRTIQSAMRRARAQEARGYRYSYDMLGEGARTADVAQDYFAAYTQAIDAIGRAHEGKGPLIAAGISVKLSALHPRYEYPQRARLMRELLPLLKRLCLQARAYDIGLTIDAEEARRLDLSLDVIERIFTDPDLVGWYGFGVAVQAYQKRAPLVIDYLADMARRVGRRMMVRLVKGAYWDSEIKHAQVQGLSAYPVFTRKSSTDICYQACARKLLDYRDCLYPQFATHNAWTVAAILGMDESRQGYEFQRLHGMGEALYSRVMRDHKVPCRIYAPVGEHEDLLAYLVRRLLENGANSSFVNNIVDDHVPVETLIKDPVLAAAQWATQHNPAIPLPRDIYAAQRVNSGGIDISDVHALQALSRDMARCPEPEQGGDVAIHNPANLPLIVGRISFDSAAQMLEKLDKAQRAYRNTHWPAETRAAFLNRLADALEQHRSELVQLCTQEAGKTLADGVAEIREAVDFCRYYAHCIQELPAAKALGVVLCISPWNFPLAIFLGQIAAALAAGNAVLAKPAEQTSLIALRALELMRECGLPDGLVQGVVAKGVDAGAVLLSDVRIQAVVFTGSMATARGLFQRLAQRTDAPIPLIAETGGQNAMIVDSTALPEQLLDDVIRSAFQSAGQRCSALRVLYLPDDIADDLITMLKGAMDELCIGDPADLATDIGPVIDACALARLKTHQDKMSSLAGVALLHQRELTATHQAGHFFAPCLYQIDNIKQLEQEVFGPVLHVVRYQAVDLDAVVAQINAAGYGLTFGIHTRVQATADQLSERIQAGNVYVNRDMIAAVVGVQPFGGRGLSGTGPKAGGPLYVQALMNVYAGDVHLPSAQDLAPCLLASATGERNLYLREPRGTVVAVYADSDALEHGLATMDTVLATGNQLMVYAPKAWQAALEERWAYWRSQGVAAHRLRFAVGQTWEPQVLQQAAAVVVAPASTALPALLGTLRQATGALPRLVCEQLNPCYWTNFIAEKLISTDTTAAGGNASLMTLPQ